MLIRTGRSRLIPPRGPAASAIALASLCVLAASAQAQLVQIKTLPMAEGDQFAFFPSANQGMAGVSIALADSLLDPFLNPAKGARLRAPHFFGSPTFYSLSRNAGGGQTLPVGGLLTSKRWFAGAVVALQEVDANRTDVQFFPPGLETRGSGLVFPSPEQARSQQNNYAFAMFGQRLERANISIAGSIFWAGLRRIDGVDLLYAGSQSVKQQGKTIDARLGALKEWSDGQSLEAVMLHGRLDMAHDVAFADAFWDPNLRITTFGPRLEHNIDRSSTWGLHLAYQRPLSDSGWRMGAVLTTNLLSHPKLPNYEVAQVVQPIPWDPGHSAAYNVGIGISRAHGPTTFGIDAIYEPIRSHTWGEAPTPLETATGGTVPAGGKTTENHFTFSNAIVRTGVGHELRLEGVEHPIQLQLGVAVHSIHYRLDQFDHVQLSGRQQEEKWMEWTRTWGLSFRASTVELRYLGRLTTGVGRPGIAANSGRDVFLASPSSSSNIIAAPSGPLTLTDIGVLTHQFSVSLPLR